MIVHRSINNILQDDDYGIQGEFLISIWSKQSCSVLSERSENGFVLTPEGESLKKIWESITKHFDNVILKEFIITENKIYGIINIDIYGKEAAVKPVYNSISHFEITFGMMISQKNPFLLEGSVFHIVNWFKASSLIEIRKSNNDFIWEAGYYEFKLESKKERNLLNDIMKSL